MFVFCVGKFQQFFFPFEMYVHLKIRNIILLNVCLVFIFRYWMLHAFIIHSHNTLYGKSFKQLEFISSQSNIPTFNQNFIYCSAGGIINSVQHNNHLLSLAVNYLLHEKPKKKQSNKLKKKNCHKKFSFPDVYECIQMQ